MTRSLIITAVSALMAFAPAAHAQTASDASLAHASSVATACLGNWAGQPCLAALAESNMTLAAGYGSALEESGSKTAAEEIKQHCAASTAAREQTVPAYAMRSAMTECANAIGDVATRTGTLPDQSLLQLMTVGVWCLEADPRCAPSAEQLQKYAR